MDCTVCYDAVEGDNSLYLPCGHVFHAVCIGTWLYNCYSRDIEPHCPICRAGVEHRCSSKRVILCPIIFPARLKWFTVQHADHRIEVALATDVIPS